MRRLLFLAVVVFFVPFALAEIPVTADELLWGVQEDVSDGSLDGSVPIVLPLANQIDQNQPSNPVFMAAFSQGDLAQSFKQTHDNISGAGIHLRAGTGTSDIVTIQLWANDLPPSGTMLVEESATGTQGEWVDVFWASVAVTPGTTYYLVFTGNTTLGIYGDTANPYPDGCVYANSGYQQFPDYDYTFRTYYDDGTSLERTTWAGVKTSF